MNDDGATLRAKMVNTQLRTFDVTDHRVQDAMATVPRERFVPEDGRIIAYSDIALPLTFDEIGRPARCMTRPAVLARLLQLIQIDPADRVLVVGAGLGYTAAVVALLAREVVALEVEPRLADGARAALDGAGVKGVEVVTGPLVAGWPPRAPYGAIVVDGAVEVPLTALYDQLGAGGRLVALEGRGLAGRALIAVRGEAGVSTRYAFNAAADVLPGFAPEPSFTF